MRIEDALRLALEADLDLVEVAPEAKPPVCKLLGQGDKVKVTIMFRGREQSRPELGYRLLQKLAEDLGENAVIEAAPLQDGRNMTMVLAPTRRKATKTVKTSDDT